MVPLGGGKTGMPDLWLEMRPTRAFAAQPRIDTNWVNFTLGLQAETRVLPAETKPDATIQTMMFTPGQIVVSL